MKRLFAVVFALSLFLAGCSSVNNSSAPQSETPSPEVTTPELEKTDWQAVSADAETFDLSGSSDNPKFEYVLNHTDTVPLDQLVAFTLAADAANEGASEELRSRFLEAPNTVLAYLVLMGDQKIDGEDSTPAVELVCKLIASADAAWHGGSTEFAQTMEACRKTYPSGPAAKLLDVMEAEHTASLERNQ